MQKYTLNDTYTAVNRYLGIFCGFMNYYFRKPLNYRLSLRKLFHIILDNFIILVYNVKYIEYHYLYSAVFRRNEK